jgi:hypothetical protein
MKKIKIKSHSNLQPFKNMKVQHSIWGLNEVSFEISNVYVQMLEFSAERTWTIQLLHYLRYEKN